MLWNSPKIYAVKISKIIWGKIHKKYYCKNHQKYIPENLPWKCWYKPTTEIPIPEFGLKGSVKPRCLVTWNQDIQGENFKGNFADSEECYETCLHSHLVIPAGVFVQVGGWISSGRGLWGEMKSLGEVTNYA